MVIIERAALPDDRFWVRLIESRTPDGDLRWQIHGNAHTHRGHFHVCSIGRDLHRSVALSTLAEMSPEAGQWITGFLAGQEASAYEFMGSSDSLLEAMDEDDVDRWQEWNRVFTTSGEASALSRMPPDLTQISHGVRAPWTYVAGRYWSWAAGRWSVLAQQPSSAGQIQGWYWPGSRCEQTSSHRLEQVGEVALCEQCALVSY